MSFFIEWSSILFVVLQNNKNKLHLKNTIWKNVNQCHLCSLMWVTQRWHRRIRSLLGVKKLLMPRFSYNMYYTLCISVSYSLNQLDNVNLGKQEDNNHGDGQLPFVQEASKHVSSSGWRSTRRFLWWNYPLSWKRVLIRIFLRIKYYMSFGNTFTFVLSDKVCFSFEMSQSLKHFRIFIFYVHS